MTDTREAKYPPALSARHDDLPRVYPELFGTFQHELYAFEDLPYMFRMFGVERIIVVDVRRT